MNSLRWLEVRTGADESICNMAECEYWYDWAHVVQKRLCKYLSRSISFELNVYGVAADTAFYAVSFFYNIYFVLVLIFTYMFHYEYVNCYPIEGSRQ